MFHRQRGEQDRLLLALLNHAIRVEVALQLFRKQFKVIATEDRHCAMRVGSNPIHRRQTVVSEVQTDRQPRGPRSQAVYCVSESPYYREPLASES